MYFRLRQFEFPERGKHLYTRFYGKYEFVIDHISLKRIAVNLNQFQHGFSLTIQFPTNYVLIVILIGCRDFQSNPCHVNKANDKLPDETKGILCPPRPLHVVSSHSPLLGGYPILCLARGDISGAGGDEEGGNFLSTCILSTHYRCMCNGHCINRHDFCTRHSVRGTTMQKVSGVCCAV